MKKNKTSVIEDLIDIASCLPWWAGIALAFASYFILSIFSVDVGSVTQVDGKVDVGSTVSTMLFSMFATIGKYLLPFAFTIGAGLSAYKQYKNTGLVNLVKVNGAENGLNSLTWREFEQMVGEAFRKQGFNVRETPGGPDGGIDLVLEKAGKKILVQCKHWKAQKVGVKTVRELFGVLIDSGADEVNIVCSGKFTDDAKSFVKDKAIYLIDGNTLLTLVENV